MISLLSLLILAYSTVLQFSMPSFVLCFGDDGHIAFEQSDENYHCVETDTEDDHPIHKHKNLSHQEENCQDIPLKTVLLTFYLKKDGEIKTVIPIIASVTINKVNAYLDSHFNIDIDDPIIHSSMKSLQSTILLI